MNHPAAWHDRQLAHVRACLAEADRAHTPEEIAAAHAALAVRPRRAVKRYVMHAFLRGFLPASVVTATFRLLKLRSL
jgi:hypothetical protein